MRETGENGVQTGRPFNIGEIWYSRVTGEVFWRAIPADRFDPERHGFRLSTVTET